MNILRRVGPSSLWVLVTACGLSVPLVLAQSTNGTTTLVQDMLSAAGEQVGGGNPIRLISVMGEPAGGLVADSACTIRSGYHVLSTVGGSRTIAVEGTVDDPGATVTVNTLPASVNGAVYRADGIRIIEGPNTITATATDPAGRRTTKTITVYLDSRPPAKPTAATVPAVTTGTSFALTGTKMPGTSIWINGAAVVTLNDFTTWTATVSLVEGDNVFSIITKDAAGNPSATAIVTLILDTLPPVITVSAPSKTNLTPLILTGSVDDSLTQVEVNGVPASRSGKAFEVVLPLIEGPNPLTIIATSPSPNNFVSTKPVTVTLGTIPTITATQPTAGAIVYANTPTAIQATATDKENDPMQYRVFIDGSPLSDWASAATQAWTATLGQIGPHTLRIMARDDDGGSRVQDVEIYVVRPPLKHP